MNIRIIIIYLILCIASPFYISGQAYIEGVAPAMYDSLRNDFLQLTQDTKNEEASILADSLYRYFESIRHTNGNIDVLQNYYYSLIKLYEIKEDLNILDKNDSQYIYSLESDITEVFSESHILLPLYYNLAALLKREVDRDFEKAISYIDKSLEIRRKYFADKEKDYCRDLVSKGYALSDLRRFTESRVCFEEALRIRKSIQPTNTISILYSYYALGVNYFREKEYEKSLSVLNEGYETAEDVLPITHDLYIGLVRAIGVMHSELGDVSKALKFALKGLESAKAKNNKSEIEINYHYQSIAKYYKELGRVKLANAYVDTAIMIIEKSNTKRRLTATYLDKATYANDLNTAIALSKKALAICPDDPLCQQTDPSLRFRISFTNASEYASCTCS